MCFQFPLVSSLCSFLYLTEFGINSFARGIPHLLCMPESQETAGVCCLGRHCAFLFSRAS